ncbi:INO80 complex subunit C [Gouania willdenowi]|uniref:Vps72/YL1 C-terminal domain-containing protein n=1 Tax=Gouania willdenowi TaxID=441366 RepID=A0A8C5EFB6_GOUWI|nr:INO80 complex subunit C [Gouania willdenowi]
MASQLNITVKSQPSAASSAAPRSKKRPVGPPVSGSTLAAVSCSNSGSKKKKTPPSAAPTAAAQIVAVETVAEVKPSASTEVFPTPNTESTSKPPPFKDATFMHSGIGGAAAGKKNRTWKNLKQILALERTLPWTLDDPTYYNIEAPPSLKPAKKYSDISGLPANYTDPQTKLRFTSTEEFAYIRLLPTDVVTGYLTLRKATSIVP